MRRWQVEGGPTGGGCCWSPLSAVGFVTGLAACGSHNRTVGGGPGGSTSTAKSVTTTTGPGWENGIWVGTGSAQDQQLIYVAKESAILSDIGYSFGNAASDWSQVAQYVTSGFLQKLEAQMSQFQKSGEHFVEPQEDGIATAQAEVSRIHTR